MKLNMLLILVCMLCINGCATIDKKISLNYNQVDKSFGRHTGVVFVIMQSSKPPVKNEKGEIIVGKLNNANGVHKANILADYYFDQWIYEALLRELKVLGYSPSLRQKLSNDADYAVVISNILISLNVNKGVSSDDTKQQLKFNVELFSGTTKVKSFSVASSDNRTIPISASNTELEKIMSSSLKEAMLQVLPEIIKLTPTK